MITEYKKISWIKTNSTKQAIPIIPLSKVNISLKVLDSIHIYYFD